MSDEVMFGIMVTECQGIDEPDLAERIKACMRRTYDHWMVIDEDMQFRGALAAAMVLSETGDREHIQASLKPLQALSALMSGVPVDLDRVVREQEAAKEAGQEPIPLRKLWDDVKAQAKAAAA